MHGQSILSMLLLTLYDREVTTYENREKYFTEYKTSVLDQFEICISGTQNTHTHTHKIFSFQSNKSSI